MVWHWFFLWLNFVLFQTSRMIFGLLMIWQLRKKYLQSLITKLADRFSSSYCSSEYFCINHDHRTHRPRLLLSWVIVFLSHPSSINVCSFHWLLLQRIKWYFPDTNLILDDKAIFDVVVDAGSVVDNTIWSHGLIRSLWIGITFSFCILSNIGFWFS